LQIASAIFAQSVNLLNGLGILHGRRSMPYTLNVAGRPVLAMKAALWRFNRSIQGVRVLKERTPWCVGRSTAAAQTNRKLL
jgi:hypothetical protein